MGNANAAKAGRSTERDSERTTSEFAVLQLRDGARLRFDFHPDSDESGDESDQKKARLDLDGSGRGIIEYLTDLVEKYKNDIVSLEVKSDRLDQLPASFSAELSALRSLVLRDVGLVALPDSIRHLQSLTELDLKGNRLRELPAALGTLSKLETLTLSLNMIASLADLSGLVSLRRLSLRANPAKRLDRLTSLQDLSQLTWLDLCSCGRSADYVEFLPKSLVRLDLSNGGITTVPDSLFGLTALEWLNLSHNAIETLPDSFSALQRLRKLSVQVTRLRKVAAAVLALGKLEVLALAHTMVEVPQQAARGGSRAALRYLREAAGISVDPPAGVPPAVAPPAAEPLRLPKAFKLLPTAKSSCIRMPQGATSLAVEVLRDKLLGCLYGNALGDAIGLATEFLTKEQAEFFYDSPVSFGDFIDDPHRSRWKPGDWTDDTDQMLLILQGLIQNDGRVEPPDFAERLQHWVYNGFPELGDTGGCGCGALTFSVISHPEFPANAHVAAREAWEARGRQVAPNGAVMRTSVLGIPNFHSIEKVIEQTRQIALTTHADPRCVASSVAVTVVVALVLQGKYDPSDPQQLSALIDEAFAYARQEVGDAGAAELGATLRPPSLASLQLDEPSAIGYTYKSLGAGFYALASEKSFMETISEITLEAGDADTNCAVAGALLGLKVGYSRLPQEWLSGIVNPEWFNDLLERLFALMGLGQSDDGGNQ